MTRISPLLDIHEQIIDGANNNIQNGESFRSAGTWAIYIYFALHRIV